MPRGPASPDPTRHAHAPGAPQPDPTWGWDIAGNPIDEADGWRPVPAGTDPLADPEQWEAWLAAAEPELAPPDPEGDPRWCPDPDDPALPDDVDLDGLRAESRRIAAAQAAEQAAEAEWAARAAPGCGDTPGRGEGGPPRAGDARLGAAGPR